MSHYSKYFVGYGCWCNFDKSGHLSGSGRGYPVDKWDANCKTLKNNYDCIARGGFTDITP